MRTMGSIPAIIGRPAKKQEPAACRLLIWPARCLHRFMEVHRLATDANLAMRRREVAGDDLDQGRFARAVVAHEAERLARAEVQVDLIQGMDGAEVLGHRAQFKNGIQRLLRLHPGICASRALFAFDCPITPGRPVSNRSTDPAQADALRRHFFEAKRSQTCSDRLRLGRAEFTTSLSATSPACARRDRPAARPR